MPYWDPITSHAVDILHNLFLGTAKKYFNSLIKTGQLNDKNLKIIDERISKMEVPSGFGRLPKILLQIMEVLLEISGKIGL